MSRKDDRMTRRAFAALPLALASAQSARAQTQGPRKWTLFIVNHSHIDVGYTERQEIIAAQHAQFVRQAVAFALSPAQRERQPDNRFKFTCEGFWQVEQFLARASAEERRQLIRALKEGLIELTAAYFHMTELPDQELLRRSVSFAAQFAKRENVPLSVSMECDINGLSWGMADALAEIGVRYLSMNINPHHGGYPLKGPHVPFYWETPSGKRLLAWVGMAYHKANLFGLMGGLTPDYDPGVPGLTLPGHGGYVDVQDISFAERKVFPVLEGIERAGYPFDFLPVMGSGIYTDNSPPNELYCRILRDWNQKHGDRVYIRTATQAEFFHHLEQHAAKLPTYRGEWTDWWSEGVAATPVDTLVYRNALRSRRLIDKLDPSHVQVAPGKLVDIDRKLLLYAEHTFGYSHTSSTQLLAQQVFMRKTLHAVEADELASASLFTILRQRGEGEFTDRRPTEYRVINPLDAPVQAAVWLPTDSWEQPIIQKGFRVEDAAGKLYPHQTEPSFRGARTAVVVSLGPKEERALHFVMASPPPRAKPATESSFENASYRIAWQADKGLVEWLDRSTGADLLNAAAGGLGSPVYQLFPGGKRWEAGAVNGKRVRPPDQVTRGSVKAIRRTAAGPVYERWEFQYEVPGVTQYALQATFYAELPQIELTASMVKTTVRDPEGMYVYFPVALAGGVWHLDKPGAAIRPGIDQLPEACSDYFCVQSGAALVGKESGFVLTTLDAPMVQLGNLRLWTYSKKIEPTGPLYSWLTNNKWETNFRLDCGGAYEFRYVLQAGKQFVNAGDALNQCRALTYPPIVVRA